MAVEQELRRGINLMKQGKEEGFNLLYSYTYNFVYSRAKVIMKDEEDALDLTQETFIQAYKGIHSLEDVDNVYAWLGAIVYNQGMKIFRKKKEVLVEEGGEFIFEDLVSEDTDLRPEEKAQAQATSEIVMGMVNELPELQRAAIVAFYYDNMKIEDIARVFDCSANTIKSRLNYAKKFLKAKVEEHERQNRYKLHVFSPTVLYMAVKSLFATGEYTLSSATAAKAYGAACEMLGVVPSAITAALGAQTAVTAGAQTAATAGAQAAAATTQATATAGAATQTAVTTGAAAQSAVGTATAAATKAGLTVGAKIGIAAAVAGTVGAAVTGGVLYSNSPQALAARLKQQYEAGLEERNMTESNIMDLDLLVEWVIPMSEEDQKRLDEMAGDILEDIITPDMSELETVKAIHDYMIMNLDYDYNGVAAGTIPETSYTAEGALTTGYAVCSGYSQVFDLLCENAGMECEYIAGMASWGAHTWNLVKVDEEWYHIDVAWDDSKDRGAAFDYHLDSHYNYFLLSDEDISGDYQPFNAEYTCTADSITYDALEYGCPWIEENPELMYIDNDEALRALVSEKYEAEEMSFHIVTRAEKYSKEVLEEYVGIYVREAGTIFYGAECSMSNAYMEGHYEEWEIHLKEVLEPGTTIESNEELRAYINLLFASETYNESVLVYLKKGYYSTSAVAQEIAMMGHQLSFSMSEEEVVEGYYSATILIN